MGFSTQTNQHLIRANLWSNDLKKFFDDELMAMRYVKMITNFPDGDVINIPSIGQATVLDYTENQSARYTAMDTGNYQFSINKYKHSATFITDKMEQDSMYSAELISNFVPAQQRAIAKAMEVDILRTMPYGQTAGSNNVINGAYHRWVGSGANETIDVTDFAKAKYALQKANVPMTNLVAIVDPSVEFKLATLSNLTSLSWNPKWEGIITSGLSDTTGMKFIVNIYGFDVYISQNLAQVGAETLNAKTTTQGVANLFFSAAAEASPIVGLIRQPPRVETERNKDLQRQEYLTTCRYGFGLYRPENTVVVLTDTDQVNV